MLFREALQEKLDVLKAKCLEQDDVGPIQEQIRHIEHLMKQLDSEEGALFKDLLDVLQG